MDIKPCPPSFLGIHNLTTFDLGYNAPYMVNNFLVFTQVISNFQNFRQGDLFLVSPNC